MNEKIQIYDRNFFLTINIRPIGFVRCDSSLDTLHTLSVGRVLENLIRTVARPAGTAAGSLAVYLSGAANPPVAAVADITSQGKVENRSKNRAPFPFPAADRHVYLYLCYI